MRHQIDNKNVNDIIINYADKEWKVQLEHKGNGIFVSSHEILGCLMEEVREFEDAVRSNDLNKLKEELTDILVVALHGLASIESGKLDWPKDNKEKNCLMPKRKDA